MTEAHGKSLKAIEREINSLKPRQRWFDQEIDIITQEIHRIHAEILEHKGDRHRVRTLLPEWVKIDRRFDKYRADFAKFSRKISALRVRVDAIDTIEASPETLAMTEAFTALLDGSHRLQIILDKNKKETKY